MDIFDYLIKTYFPRLRYLPNVVGVGKGKKHVGGEEIDQESMVVLVEKKLPEKELTSSQIVPKNIDQVQTDVIEVGEIRLLSNRTAFERPAHPGISIGHYKITAGTFGAVVKDKRTGQPYILSNNHVLANVTNGRDGRAKPGDPILQPGPYDGGKTEQVIGYLERFIPLLREYDTPECSKAQLIEFLGNQLLGFIHPSYRLNLMRKSGTANRVDAALAKPVNPNAISPEILEIGTVKGVREPEIGMTVRKSGRSTGLTTAKVKVVNTTLQVSLTENEKGVFTDQFVTTVMSKGGDSGSLIVDENNYAVGLLFAGSDTITVGNKIQNVLDTLDVTF